MRAAEAERSRLEGKREQLLRKREAVRGEGGEIDRAIGAIGELLELLEPLLPANGSEPGADGDDGGGEAVRGALASERAEADEGDPHLRAAPGTCDAAESPVDRLADAFGGAANQRQPTKEQSR